MQEAEKERVQTSIGILSALADDIYSGVASILSEKASRCSMREAFKEITAQPVLQIDTELQEKQERLAWLSFLGKAELF